MTSSSSTSISHYLLLLLLCVFLSNWCFTICLAHRTLGFDLHHRFSDKVKGILPVEGLPLEGTVEYYVAMAHRDRFLHGRRLASTDDQPPLTFADGNDTYLISSLGFLHYASVSVGTPPLTYLVALDTGSDLFWLPCECTQCVSSLNTTNRQINLNIYNTSLSSTSRDVPCSSSLCDLSNQCTAPTDTCPYQVQYLSSNTSSTGFLVEDVLHLITDNEEQKAVNANITLGCGEVQTGIFLNGAAPNGLFGLGIEDIAVPTILAKQGLTSNSFSMCFGSDGVGRIDFGDNGTLSQKETPIDAVGRHPTYRININQITVGKNVTDLNFTAIFDTGTSFTYLTDPSYSVITQTFNAIIQEKRYLANSNLPFEYCYEYNQSANFYYPEVNLTLQGGEQFSIMSDLLILVRLSDETTRTVQNLLCLSVVKSEDISLIGQNFMTGYRLVFDREKMVLGWTEADCYSSIKDNTTADAPSITPSSPTSPSVPPAVSPATAVNPSNTSNGNNTAAPAPKNHAAKSNPITYALLILLFLGLTIV